jgi:hypothetical protein
MNASTHVTREIKRPAMLMDELLEIPVLRNGEVR